MSLRRESPAAPVVLRPRLCLRRPLKGSSRRVVYRDDVRIGDVENYGRGDGWATFTASALEHSRGFKTRAQAVAWLGRVAP